MLRFHEGIPQNPNLGLPRDPLIPFGLYHAHASARPMTFPGTQTQPP
jgi:hypothetical protein